MGSSFGGRPTKKCGLDEHAATDVKRLRVVALRALARKDYGLSELRRKLEDKGYAKAQVEEVLAGLSAEGLISDSRYAEVFVRQHAAKGHGPARIRADLRSRGVPADSIQAALANSDIDWAALASRVRAKRFGTKPPRNGPERAKQGRFLQYRGFDSDHVRAAFQSAARSLHDVDDETFAFDDEGPLSSDDRRED